MRRALAATWVWLVAACGEGGSGEAADGPQPPGGAAGTSAMCPSEATGATGSGSITGSVRGMGFDTVASSRWIGAPDSLDTSVVYVFSTAVACTELCSPGWDQRIVDQSRILELKMFGTSPATFTVVTTATPGPGEASVNYTLASTSGTPAEVSSSRGSVTLDMLEPGQRATGSYALAFGTEMLTGTFDASFCPGGHEP